MEMGGKGIYCVRWSFADKSARSNEMLNEERVKGKHATRSVDWLIDVSEKAASGVGRFFILDWAAASGAEFLEFFVKVWPHSWMQIFHLEASRIYCLGKHGEYFIPTEGKTINVLPNARLHKMCE